MINETTTEIDQIVDSLIDECNKQRRRADLLQAYLDMVDEMHFDECQKLREEIARLKLRARH